MNADLVMAVTKRETMKLFDVTTVLKQYDGCKDVGFHWFRDDKPEGRPYAELISGYDPEFSFAPEERIDELFTEDEAAQLKAHLDQQYGKAGVTTITEAALPIANNQTGAGSIAVGGGNDFLRLRSFLPFKVRADERRSSRRPPRCPLQAHFNADRRPRCLAGGASGTRRGSSSWRAPKREGSGSSGGRWSWRNGCAGEEEEDDGRIESVTAARRALA
jgi:hypothetical protein